MHTCCSWFKGYILKNTKYLKINQSPLRYLITEVNINGSNEKCETEKIFSLIWVTV